MTSSAEARATTCSSADSASTSSTAATATTSRSRASASTTSRPRPRSARTGWRPTPARSRAKPCSRSTARTYGFPGPSCPSSSWAPRWPETTASGARRQIQLRRAPDRLAPRRRAELRQHRGDVMLRGARRDDEPLRDLGVRQPFSEQCEDLELAYGESGWVGARRVPRPLRYPDPQLPHAHAKTPRERLGSEPAGDLDRLDERLLVVEQRQHQRPVVGPADVAEGVGGSAPVAAGHGGVRRRHRLAGLPLDP